MCCNHICFLTETLIWQFYLQYYQHSNTSQPLKQQRTAQQYNNSSLNTINSNIFQHFLTTTTTLNIKTSRSNATEYFRIRKQTIWLMLGCILGSVAVVSIVVVRRCCLFADVAVGRCSFLQRELELGVFLLEMLLLRDDPSYAIR